MSAEAPTATSITPILRLAVDKGASDIYFSSNAPVILRVEGRMLPVKDTFLSRHVVEDMAYKVMTPEQRSRFEVQMDVDFATQAGGLGRFRVNVFRQRGHVAMVWRHVKSQVPSLDDLGMPAVLKDVIMHRRGLVLMVGPAGCGKSTTLAAMIDHRNASASAHILTIEDPIEFLHSNQRSIVNQREVGVDTRNYEAALESALREAPDVIQVGEVRNHEVMATVLQLAGSGHLAVSTLHANNAYQSLQRIVNMFPEDAQRQLYMDLSLTLRAVVSQRLVPGKDNKRVAAVEVMLNTPFISELILHGRIDEIREVMIKSSEKGMQTFEDSLYELYLAGRVSAEAALDFADSRTNLEARINFGS